MKVHVSFANPFLMVVYTASMLLTGWAIGARWGHTLTAGWALLLAVIFLVVHDTFGVAAVAIAATKAASSERK